MSTVGLTREEIREYVHQYNLQPHGTRTAWTSMAISTAISFQEINEA